MFRDPDFREGDAEGGGAGADDGVFEPGQGFDFCVDEVGDFGDVVAKREREGEVGEGFEVGVSGGEEVCCCFVFWGHLCEDWRWW